MEGKLARNVQIESLRAFAIVFVMFSHFAIYSRDWAFDLYSHLGLWVGVDLFFVVSGYLMTQQLTTRLAGHQKGRIWPELKAFWVRRAFRLFPAAWVCLSVTLLLFALLPAHPFISIKLLAHDALAAFLHLYNFFIPYCFQEQLAGTLCSQVNIFHPYWSLSLEEQFYLLLPLFLIMLSRRWLILMLCCALIGMFFWVRGLFTFEWHLRVDGLLWGVLIALLGANRLSPLSQWIRRLRVGPLLSLSLLGLMVWLGSLGYTVSIGYGISSIAAVSLCAALIVWLALNDNGINPRYGMLWVGSRSYALYLVHYPMYYMCQLLIIPHNIGFPLDLVHPSVVLYILSALAASAVAAELVYRFVETPMRTYGRQVAERVAQDAATQPLDASVVANQRQ